MAEHVLLIDDEPSLQLTLADTLRDEGMEVTVAGTVSEAIARFEERRPSLVLCDLRLPDGTGIDVLRFVRDRDATIPFIILTAHATVGTAVDAMKLGANEFLSKPFEQAQLLAVVRRYAEIVALRRQVKGLTELGATPIGADPGFLAALETARAAAPSNASVLILGETGTGKEVVARYIHDHSRRAGREFVAVNCAALPDTLLEAELFGHERGAFTGAIRDRRGRFDEADGGTLFLDEVAEMSQVAQAKLLRVLQEGTFERLGSNLSRKVDVRILAATRRDLQREVEVGRFRDDLYYRLRVIPLVVPSLRERSEDIPLLAQYFAHRFGRESNRDLEFADSTLRCLKTMPFPGNVRELENLVRRLAVLCNASVIEPRHLPDDYARACTAIANVDVSRYRGTLAEMTRAFERDVIDQALKSQEGSRAKTADLLGISRKNLWEKLRSHGLDSKDS